MGRQLPAMLAKEFLRGISVFSEVSSEMAKGCLAVYVGKNEKKRFVVLVSYLDQPSFQDLLHKVKEEYGFHHPMGVLTIPFEKRHVHRHSFQSEQMMLRQGDLTDSTS